MKKIYIYSAALAATFGLSACDTSSAAAAPSENQNTIKSVDDLTNCTENKAGQIEVVQANVATDYICAGFDGKYQWVALSETKGYADDFKVCNDTREGLFALAKDEQVLFVCTDYSWVKAAKFESIKTKEAASNDDDATSSGSKNSTIIDDDDEEDIIKSSSSKKQTVIDDDDDDEEDINSETRVKAVNFANGIIWQPSYGRRAYTGEQGVDEYNFLTEDDGGAGWWYKYLDDGSGGSSIATGKFSETDLTLNYSLSYFGFHEEIWTSGKLSGYFYAPEVYPYAGFGFDLRANQAAMNIYDFSSGICVVYTATKKTALVVASKLTNASGANFLYELAPTTSATTVNAHWDSFVQPKFAIDQGLTEDQTEALTNAISIIFSFGNDEAGVTSSTACGGNGTLARCESYAEANNTNTIQIFKIGKYGMCSNSDL